MPFNPTGSVVSTDLDNMFRGLYRDNSDRVITGTTAETPMAGVNISPNTIGPTGQLFVHCVGATHNSGGTKTVRLYFGSTLLHTIVVPAAGDQWWFIKSWIWNIATNSQKIYSEGGSVPVPQGSAAAPVLSYFDTTAAIDTSQNQVLQLRTQNASAGDFNTSTMFDVYVIQIT